MKRPLTDVLFTLGSFALVASLIFFGYWTEQYVTASQRRYVAATQNLNCEEHLRRGDEWLARAEKSRVLQRMIAFGTIAESYFARYDICVRYRH